MCNPLRTRSDATANDLRFHIMYLLCSSPLCLMLNIFVPSIFQFYHKNLTMSIFAPPPKPKTPLGWHRILSPNANAKVSPIAIGGISFGNSWSELFGKSEDAFKLLDTFYDLGGNFIDTANMYNGEESEKLIGEWMEKRRTRDQMVVATKYGGGYKSWDREGVSLQSNYTGPSAKSMHISVRDSLRKLRTDYIDILYVHWYVSGATVVVDSH